MVLAAIAGLFVISVGAYYIYAKAAGNFHAISSGQAYRSGQLNKDQLKYYINKFNLKSILNLQGKNSGAEWYRDEVNVCATYDIMHYYLRLASRREPRDDELEQLVHILNSAPRPILIHCKDGADRTGLAAAIWKVAMDKEPEFKAWKQFSIFYGHFSYGKAGAMDRGFRRWLKTFYTDVNCKENPGLDNGLPERSKT